MGPDYTDPDYLSEAYYERRLSLDQIAEECECSQSTVRRHMEKNGLERRSISDANGPLSLCNHTKGYEYFQSRVDGEAYSVYHHRLLAVAVFGFDSVAGSVVHHKNGIKWDNRPENLEVLADSSHKSLHADDRDRVSGVFA